jgi:hypothetical protein
MSEHDEQVALFNVLYLYQGKYPILKWIFAIPNGGKRHPATAVKLKREGVKSGAWDIFVPFAVDEYCGMFVEMKYGKNTLSDNQIAFNLDVGNAYKWIVCYSAIEACHAIGEYLGISELMEVA